MSKLIVFGDSFTKCFGEVGMTFRETTSFVTKEFFFDRDKDKVSNWVEPLSEALGCEEVLKFAYWGWTNYIILDNLISNLDKITKEDVVVIGSSTSERMTYFDNSGTDQMIPLHQYSAEELVEHLDEENDFTTPRLPWKYFDNDKIRSILDFYFHNIGDGNDNHIRIENFKHIEKLDYLSEFIRKTIGCRVLRWSSDCWNYKVYPSQDVNESKDELEKNYGPSCMFETNYMWMNRTVFDSHWSPNGLRGAALFFEYCIKSNIHYAHKKELAHWYLSQGKAQMDALDYIPFQPR